MVRLAWNENPFGPAATAKSAMAEAVLGSCRYAFGQEKQLLEVIAAKERCRVEQIVLGSGSGEILDIAGLHFGLEKGEVVVADPAYMQLVSAAEKAGGKAVKVPLNARLEHDLSAMAAAVNSRTSVVYVVNPNNPTGTVVEAGALKDFVKSVSRRVPVFIDEAYLDCADDYAARTCAPLVAEGFNVVVARTFSKIYGMAGMRLGYAIMPEALAKSLRPRMTGSLSLPTYAGAFASLNDPDYVPMTRAKIKAGRDALIAELRSLGKRYAEPQGNFVFFETGMPAQEFQAKMRGEGVSVGRPFPPLLNWARVTIGLPEEMAACHRALRAVLAT
jgi:histidinol-phosphate aminotransferase